MAAPSQSAVGQTFTHVIVPLDGSPVSEHAIPFARRIARCSGANLSLVHVHMQTGGASVAQRITRSGTRAMEIRRQRLLAADARYLAGMAEWVAGGVHPVRVSTALLEGPVLESLLTYAEDHQGDLFVIAKQPREGLERWYLGSITEELIKHTEIPVLIVRTDALPARRFRERGFGRILIALDGSARAETILRPAFALGGSTSARYTLLYVFTGESESGGRRRWSRQRRKTRPLNESDAEIYLAGIAARFQRDGTRIDTRVVAHPNPAEVIFAVADAMKADVIAMATRGRGAGARMVFGSVANAVITDSSKTVLVTGPESVEAEVADKRYGIAHDKSPARSDVGAEPILETARIDPVDEAGFESFPASDPPAWTPPGGGEVDEIG